MAFIKNKVQKRYYSIGEVSKRLGESESTLKYWEREFDHIKPRRSPGGTRQYSESDLESIRAVQRLIRQDKLTIEGVKSVLSRRKTSLELREEALTRLHSALEKLETLYARLEQE